MGWGWQWQAHSGSAELGSVEGEILKGVSVSQGLREQMTIPSTKQVGSFISWLKKKAGEPALCGCKE